MSKSTYFLQLSDTHWAFDPIGDGIDSKLRFEKLRKWIHTCKAPIDFIVHTGDLVHRGHIDGDTGASTREMWRLSQELRIPIFPVAGNHDNRNTLADCFWSSTHNCPNFNATPCTSHPSVTSTKLSYHFTHNDEVFLVLDARDTQQIDPQGYLDPEQFQALDSVLTQNARKLTLFLHYPPIALDCDWIDRTMTIQNGIELHRRLMRYRDRIRAVFFGHIHRPTSVYVDGILYASSGSSAMHFPNLPNATSVEFQRDPAAFANYVTIRDNSIWIKPQWVSIE